jgi:hypothetical protein
MMVLDNVSCWSLWIFDGMERNVVKWVYCITVCLLLRMLYDGVRKLDFKVCAVWENKKCKNYLFLSFAVFLCHIVIKKSNYMLNFDLFNDKSYNSA